jgi:hypothetical protein
MCNIEDWRVGEGGVVSADKVATVGKPHADHTEVFQPGYNITKTISSMSSLNKKVATRIDTISKIQHSTQLADTIMSKPYPLYYSDSSSSPR